MEIKVCVGSACYVKGSHEVIEALQKLIKEQHLEEKVELKATFCLGNCTEAVSVQLEDEVFGVDKDNVPLFFEQQVCRRLDQCN